MGNQELCSYFKEIVRLLLAQKPDVLDFPDAHAVASGLALTGSKADEARDSALD